MKQPTHETIAMAKLVLAMFIFGTIGIFVRHIPLPSSVIGLTRGALGSLFLLILVLWKEKSLAVADIRRNRLILFFSGSFIGINWILLFEAYRHTSVAIATVCYYLAPVFVILASPLILKEKLTPRKLLCAAAAMLGLIFVSGVLERNPDVGYDPRGILFGVGAAVFYAGVVLLSKQLKEISAYDTTFVQVGVATLVLLPYTLLTVEPGELHFSPLTILLLVIVGILHTGFAYGLYFGALKVLKAQTMAIFSYIDPIVAILLSALLLRENLGLLGILGAGLVLGSTFISERKDVKNQLK